MLKSFVAGSALSLALACQATAGAGAHADMNGAAASADARASSQTSRSALPSLADSTTTAGTAEDPTAAPKGAMLGARAGLGVAQTSVPNCLCLAVVVGQPTDGRFIWEGERPKTNPDAQLVIGVSSKGLACPQAAKDSLGASYHGYEWQGNDVLVQVETAKLGRPIVEGGVVPKPPSGGRIVTRPVDSKSPYGRSLDDSSSSCVAWTTP